MHQRLTNRVGGFRLWLLGSYGHGDPGGIPRAEMTGALGVVGLPSVPVANSAGPFSFAYDYRSVATRSGVFALIQDCLSR